MIELMLFHLKKEIPLIISLNVFFLDVKFSAIHVNIQLELFKQSHQKSKYKYTCI